MESTIRKIASGKDDEEVHDEFIKFSRGVFNNRYLIEGKKSKNGWAVKTGPEYANFLVRKCLEKIKGNVEASGVIVSTFDIRNGMGGHVFSPEEEVKQFMGIKQLKVNGSIPISRIIEVMQKYPRAFYALTFSGDDFQLKIKAKAPKSAKPSTSGEKEASADFCSIKTGDREIIEDLFFDYSDFSEIKVKHVINIKEITLPKGEKDPVKIRENAVRRGIITRIVNIDGKEIKKEYALEA